MDETGFPVEGYGINTAECLAFKPRVSHVDLMATGCEDGSWMELTQVMSNGKLWY